jgi:hypothetical protein
MIKFDSFQNLKRSVRVKLVPERKLGFFVKIKEDENFNHRNTDRISRIEI